jgi:hypothetical protein
MSESVSNSAAHLGALEGRLSESMNRPSNSNAATDEGDYFWMASPKSIATTGK